MEWTDIGIVLGTRKHGEANAILETMTRAHGRHLGLVRGGASSRQKPILQPGNTVSLTWRARLDEHLGHFTVEGLDLRAALLLDDAHAVYGLTHLASLTRLLPERDPHENIYELLHLVLHELQNPRAAALLIARFELKLLAELGFGLDLSVCAATGVRTDLVYVSPKTGRAVSRAAGGPWHDKLLSLPAFLGAEDNSVEISLDEITAAFMLTGYFLDRYVYSARAMLMPEARQHFLTAITRVLRA